jgi:hypothetical protein
MAVDEKTGAEVPQHSHVNNPHNNTNTTQIQDETSDSASAIKKELAAVEEGYLATEGRLPSPEEQIEALGIPNWRELEKKIVRRLDMTLMPCVWCLYFFNYLDRASIGQARLSTFEEDLNLSGSNFSSAVSILSLGYGKAYPFKARIQSLKCEHYADRLRHSPRSTSQQHADHQDAPESVPLPYGHRLVGCQRRYRWRQLLLRSDGCSFRSWSR